MHLVVEVEFEQRARAFAPGWMALDRRIMMIRIQQDGMVPARGDIERLTTLLGRPLRSYRDFATETARQWAAPSTPAVSERSEGSPAGVAL